MNASRVAPGTPDPAAGTPPRPATRPAIATTISGPRSRHSPTTVSGPAPAARRYPPSRAARAISSRVRQPAPRSTPPPHPGIRATCAANNSGTPTPPAPAPPCHSTHPGPAPARPHPGPRPAAAGPRVRGHRRQHPDEPAPRSPVTVSSSNRSAAPVRRPCSPAGRPCASSVSPSSTSRSNRARPGLDVDVAGPHAGQVPRRRRASFCMVSMTWNSGWRASDRSGASSSTRRSNGTSWWSRAASQNSRTRSSSVGERRVAGQVGAQDQGVDEEPDQVIQRLVGPPGDRGPDRDVVPAPSLRQQHRQRGLQHHEHRHALLARQVRQLPVQLGAGPPAARVCPR